MAPVTKRSDQPFDLLGQVVRFEIEFLQP